MNFESQLEGIFDIDIWLLKANYRDMNEQPSSEIQNKNGAGEDSGLVNPSRAKLLYSNKNDSDKIINIFLTSDVSISFLKNILNSLFFKSRVNIYQSMKLNSIEEYKGINVFAKDFILDNQNLLSVQSKKYIFSKLYEYSDFTTK